MATRQAASASAGINFLNPDTGVAGGLRSMFEGTIETARYEAYDFNGHPSPFQDRSGKRYSGVKMALHLHIVDTDDAPEPIDVFWPAGAIEDFVPNEDGDGFEAVTGRTGFAKDSEILQGTAQIVETGALKQSELGIDPSIFEGLRFFWETRVPAWVARQEKAGKVRVDKDGNKKDSWVMMPTKFIGVEKSGGGSGGAGKSTGASKSAGKSNARVRDDDDDEKSSGDNDADPGTLKLAVKLTLEALGDLPPKNKGKITREDLGSEVFLLCNTTYKKEVDKDQRKAINALFDDDTFLDENAGKRTWSYDTDTGVVTAAK